MPTTSLEGVPRRLVLEVPVPQRLSDENIRQTCDMVSAHLRYLLGQEFQRRSAVRLRAMLDTRAARKAARLEVTARRAEQEEAAAVLAKAEARQTGS
jgi:hypothetical protein